jgi:hypothetical protein
MVNQITNAAQSSGSKDSSGPGFSEGGKGLKQLMKLGGLSLGDNKRRESDGSVSSPTSGRPSMDGQLTAASGLQVTDRDGQVSLEVAERMLRWHAEAVGRMLELSPASEA